MLHVVGAVVVPQLAVVPEPDVQVVGVLDLVGGGDAGPERREGVEGLAEPAGGRPRGPGEAAVAAGRDVDHAGVSEHRAPPILGIDTLGRTFDDQGQLGFVHEHPGFGELRQLDHVAGAHDGVGVLHEHVDRPGLALGVLPVVADAGQDLARPGQWRAQPHLLQRDRLGLGGHLLQRRPQRLEPIDDRGHGQLGRIADPGGAGDVHHPLPRQHARQDGLLRRLLEQHEPHGFRPPPGPRLPAGWSR